MNLEELLEKWFVTWEKSPMPQWWAVGNDDDGLVAFFANKKDAYRWRLDCINRELNG